MLILEEFLPQPVLLSNRSYYLVMIRASCEFMLTFDQMEFEDFEFEEHEDYKEIEAG